MRPLVALVAVVVSSVAACGPAIDCNHLAIDACRNAARLAIEAGERHRPGDGIRRVSVGRDGAYTIEYADGSGMWVGQ